MRSFLTNALLVHWTVVFAALGLVCALEPEAGLRAPLLMLGVDLSTADLALSDRSSAVLGTVSLLSAALFFWALLSAVAGEASAAETTRLAFAVAVLVLTLLFAACAFRHVQGLTETLAALLAAALVSHLAVGSERRDEAGATPPQASPARAMALDAAHSTQMHGHGRRDTSGAD